MLETGNPVIDSDGDGMPDQWEVDNGFAPNDSADGAQDADNDGYTNLEAYLNELVEKGLGAPGGTTPLKTTPSFYPTGLSPPGPNPFSTSITIPYRIEFSAHVEISILDSKGRLIKTLFSGQKKAGIFSVSWNGRNKKTARLPNGIYFLRVEAGRGIFVKKLVLLKS